MMNRFGYEENYLVEVLYTFSREIVFVPLKIDEIIPFCGRLSQLDYNLGGEIIRIINSSTGRWYSVREFEKYYYGRRNKNE